MALISQMYNIGSGTGRDSSLPSPPAKSKTNTTDFASATTVDSNYGAVQTSYQFWPVDTVLPGHTFGIGSGGVTSFNETNSLVLRNDNTGLTVWVKTYASLPYSPSVTSAGAQAVVVDAIGNAVYILMASTGTDYYLFKVIISTGVATQLGTWSATTIGFMPPNAGGRAVSFGRFTNTSKQAIEFFGVGGAGQSDVNKWNVATVQVSNGAMTKQAVTPLVPYATESYRTFPDFVTNISATGAYIHYVTADKTIAAVIVPVKASSPSPGVVVVFRGKGRAMISIVKKGEYHYPLLVARTNGNLLVTDSENSIAFRQAGAQAGLGDPFGGLDYYSQSDLDRWLKEIADNAGLPAGTPLW